MKWLQTLNSINFESSNGPMPKEEKQKVNTTVVNDGPKVGRNDPCPCGSGLKYKNCHGKNQ